MEIMMAKFYTITPYALEKAAQVLVGEQSSGMFVAVANEIEELEKLFAASMGKIKCLEPVPEAAISGANSKIIKFVSR